MPARIVRSASIENLSSSLSGNISASATTITIADASNFLASSYAVIDRVDGTGARKATSLWEYVYISAIAGNDLTVTRAQGGSTGQTHSQGAVIEALPTAALWEDFRASYLQEHDGIGAHASLASVTFARINTHLNISGASLTGTFPRILAWRFSGAFSGASTLLMPPLMAPQGGNWQWFTFVTRTVASGVSAIVDINRAGTSIFNVVGRPMIAAGGTFVSTASIATKVIAAGDQFTIDYDGTGGLITDILVEGFYTP